MSKASYNTQSGLSVVIDNNESIILKASYRQLPNLCPSIANRQKSESSSQVFHQRTVLGSRRNREPDCLSLLPSPSCGAKDSWSARMSRSRKDSYVQIIQGPQSFRKSNRYMGYGSLKCERNCLVPGELKR
ncbi:hypothetical protein CEXT_25491 [Caerostris extrusa]|uniref:Uncharacterized protein n=1 Tax=Caerostris extrusa TaxID=172846 RepID=A0AAV4VZK9_CAEEX|nr:hypothetical protein CEXT_25491 [Caerostris extrusa]